MAGSDEELEKAWSRAGRSAFPQGQSREAHLGLRWLLRLCFRQMLQQVLLDEWELLTSSQRRSKSLVQESLQGKKPSPRCSNSLACCSGARAGQAPAHGEQPSPDAGIGFRQPRSAWRERPRAARAGEAAQTALVGRAPPAAPAPAPHVGTPWLRCQGRAGRGTDLLPRAAGRAVQPLAQRTAQALDPGVVPDGFQGCPQELQERTGEEANGSWPLTSRKRQCQGTRPRQSGIPRELWPV